MPTRTLARSAVGSFSPPNGKQSEFPSSWILPALSSFSVPRLGTLARSARPPRRASTRLTPGPSVHFNQSILWGFGFSSVFTVLGGLDYYEIVGIFTFSYLLRIGLLCVRFVPRSIALSYRLVWFILKLRFLSTCWPLFSVLRSKMLSNHMVSWFRLTSWLVVDNQRDDALFLLGSWSQKFLETYGFLSPIDFLIGYW